MNFGGFLDSSGAGSDGGGSGGGASSARLVADISYNHNHNNNNNNMSPAAISHSPHQHLQRLVGPTSINKSFFNTPGLSLALVIYFLSPLSFF